MIYFKYFLRFCFFAIIQVFILNSIPAIQSFITPYIYFICILWLPININKIFLLFIGFFYGLFIDYLTGTLGLHATLCLLLCLYRYIFLNIAFRKDIQDLNNKEPTIRLLGNDKYFIYIVLGIIIHNAGLVLIEWLEFSNFLLFIKKLFLTSLLSIFLALSFELFFLRLRKSY